MFVPAFRRRTGVSVTREVYLPSTTGFGSRLVRGSESPSRSLPRSGPDIGGPRDSCQHCISLTPSSRKTGQSLGPVRPAFRVRGAGLSPKQTQSLGPLPGGPCPERPATYTSTMYLRGGTSVTLREDSGVGTPCPCDGGAAGSLTRFLVVTDRSFGSETPTDTTLDRQGTGCRRVPGGSRRDTRFVPVGERSRSFCSGLSKNSRVGRPEDTVPGVGPGARVGPTPRGL